MIKPVENIQVNKFSHKKAAFLCDCGNEFMACWRDYNLNKIKSCGKCKFFTWKKSDRRKFNNLTLKTDVSKISNLMQVVSWTCDCGSEVSKKLNVVVNGHVASCGCVRRKNIGLAARQVDRKEELTASGWLTRLPELVNTSLPESWSSGSSRGFTFRCGCGRDFVRRFCKFRKGTTCGACDTMALTTGSEFHGFKYVGKSVDVKLSSTEFAEFVCPCGRTEKLRIGLVLRGLRKTCGRCGELGPGELTEKFGCLRVKDQDAQVKAGSERVTTFVCDCGNECDVRFSSVFNGNTKSCGRCGEAIQTWWLNNKEALRSAAFPLSASDKLVEPLGLTGDVSGPDVTITATCPACKSMHTTKFRYIRRGEGLTCGCRSGQTSAAQHDIAKELRDAGVEVIVEHEVDGRKFDLFVPSTNLVIEYHGLKWHSMNGARERDKEKYDVAVRNGLKFVCVYEDEWRDGREKVLHLLKNKAGLFKPKSVRPSQCTIDVVPMADADDLYARHHYIGPCKSKMSYGAVLDGRLIACVSFKTPTRQSSYDFELVRMVSDPGFRVHGVWRKLIDAFVRDRSPKSIVSFSENRLFDGGVYEKIGFRLDGEVSRNYYWVRGKKRFNKSGLRKPPGESRTESEIRTAEGYSKLWDLGKKRWVMRCNVRDGRTAHRYDHR